MKRGVFIAFEGIEGSGKTTQAQLIYKTLREKKLNTVFTREPGGTPCGEKIREILLSPEFTGMHPKTELLLYLSARNEHVAKKLRKAMFVDKAVIICDRYELSSFAYQGAGRGLSMKVVSRLNKFVTGGLKPDLTVLVDIEPEVALKRLNSSKDRLEQETLDFHNTVRKAYLTLAKRAPKRIKVFDGKKEKQALNEEIKECVFEVLRKKGIL